MQSVTLYQYLIHHNVIYVVISIVMLCYDVIFIIISIKLCYIIATPLVL